MMKEPTKNCRVFISRHTRAGKLSRRIRQELQVFSGNLEFVGAEDVAPGQKWREWLRHELKTSNILLLLLTTAREDFDWPLYEAGLFVSLDEEYRRKMVCIYSDLGDAVKSRENVPEQLGDTQTIKATAENILDLLVRLFHDRDFTGTIDPLNPHLCEDDLRPIAKTIADGVNGVEIAEVDRIRLRDLEGMTVVNPRWKSSNFQVEQDLCFLLMPFSEPWSNDVWALIDRVVSQASFRCERADQKDGRVVMEDIWEGINKARMVIADLTGKNPNVTYEVGLADVLGKEVLLLSQTPEDIPFDFLGSRLITYENTIGGVQKLTDELTRRLERLRNSPASRSRAK